MKLNYIHQLDCLEGLKLVDANSVNLIIADPPYLIDTLDSDSNSNRMIKMNRESYLEWSDNWIKECSRVLKNTGSMYLFGGNIIHALFPIMEKYLVFKNSISWIKKNRVVTTPQLRNWFPKCEIILFFTKNEKGYTWNQIVKEYGLMESSNYQMIANISPRMKEGVAHPSQKPLELIEKFVKASSNENDIVLDPFMGSGTTAVASKKLNRQFLGFDVDKGYVELANKRLEKTCVRIKTDIKDWF